MNATPAERLVMAVFQSGCIRCEQEFDSIDGTVVVTGLRLHTACLTDDDKLALWGTAHEAETGCTRRLPCGTCDKQMRHLWYGDAYSDKDNPT